MAEIGDQIRDWVIPFLRSIRPETVSEESYEKLDLQVPFLWRRLANLFHNNFERDYPQDVVGSVLAQMPEEAFRKFSRSYPAFILADSPGWTQRFNPVDGGSTLIVFSEELLRMPGSAARGLAAHEIAHATENHPSVPFSLSDPYRRLLEQEANEICISWGLEREITEVYRHLEERRITNYGRK